MNISSLIPYIKPFTVLKYLWYKFFSRHVKCRGKSGPIISGRGILRFGKCSKLNIENVFFVNQYCPKGSRKETIIQLGKNSRLTVDSYSIWYGGDIKVFDNAELILGRGYCNIHCLIRCKEKITIGNNVIMAHNVTIMDSDFHHIESDNHVMTKPVTIRDNVWIGNGATILKGVTIGEGSVIAAKSVVTRDVPPHTIVAGNPAKVIKEDISWRG